MIDTQTVHFEWQELRMDDLFNIVRGGSPRPIDKFLTDDPEGLNWILISDAQDGSKFITSTKKRIRREGIKKTRMVHAGTFLLTNSMSFGRPYVLQISGCIHDGWLALTPKSDQLSTNFFYHLLSSPLVYGELSSKAVGAVVKNLNIAAVSKLVVRVPPLDEQKRIAAVLDKAEALRRQRQESLDLTEKLLQSVFLEMFGDPVTNPKGWNTVELSKLGTLDRGVSKHRPRNAPELLGGKYPLIQTGDVSNAGLYITDYKQTYSDVGYKQSKMWPKGTLCITIAANIAQTGILQFDACFPDSVVGFKPHRGVSNSIYVHFLFGFLQAILEKNAPQAAQKNINLAILRSLRIPLPPIDIQDRFEKLVSDTMVVLHDQKKALKISGEFFNSLQQRAFRGELDLSRLVLDAEATEPEPKPDEIPVPEQPPKALGRATGSASFKVRSRRFIPTKSEEARLKVLDAQLERGEPIDWSPDYFRFRLLGRQAEPFRAGDILQQAATVFNEETLPKRDELVKQMLGMMEGVGEVMLSGALLKQRFDTERHEIRLELLP